MSNDGFLYQLWATSELKPGNYFPVDGPWDTHGIVVKFIRKDEEGYLHLVRGTGKKKRNLTEKEINVIGGSNPTGKSVLNIGVKKNDG